eukprot:g16586.t1
MALRHTRIAAVFGAAACLSGSGASGRAAVELEWRPLPAGRCLDGSPGGFYIESSPPSHLARKLENGVLVDFQGGGWCYGRDRAETIADCRRRAQTRLGSSRHYARRMARPFYKAALADPFVYVYVPYCDGTSMSGNATAPYEEDDHLHEDKPATDRRLFFEGHVILRELTKALARIFLTRDEDEPLSLRRVPQPRIILTGGSAGASTVFYHADKIRDQFQEAWRGGGLTPLARQFALAIAASKPLTVLAAPNAGFFLKMNATVSGRDLWGAQMTQLFTLSNGYENLHAKCLERYNRSRRSDVLVDPRDACLYEENYGDLIETPLLVLQSKYDASEISATLDIHCDLDKICAPETVSSSSTSLSSTTSSSCCTMQEVAAVKDLWPRHWVLGQPMFARRQTENFPAGNGFFFLDCVVHGVFGLPQGKSSNDVDYSGNRIGSLTAEDALFRWAVLGEETRLVDERSWALDDADKYCKRDSWETEALGGDGEIRGEELREKTTLGETAGRSPEKDEDGTKKGRKEKMMRTAEAKGAAGAAASEGKTSQGKDEEVYA